MNSRISLACALGLLICGQALGQTTFYWTFDGPSNNYPNDQQVAAGYSETRGNAAEGYATVTPEGWANTVNSTNTQIEKQVPSTGKGLWFWGGSGLGLYNLDRALSSGADLNEGSSPEHAIDNNERYEMVLLSFDKAVNLTSVRIGWPTDGSEDTDMTILAYTDTSGGPGLAAKTWSTLGSGWTLIGNYANVASRDNDAADISTKTSGIYSSYWLVGAYNDLAGGASCDTLNSGKLFCDKGDDYFKLLEVAGTIKQPDQGGPVPEPGSLALLGLALIGMISVRRRRSA